MFIYIFAVLLSIFFVVISTLRDVPSPSEGLALLILFFLLLIAGVAGYIYGLVFAFSLLTNTERLLANQRFHQMNGTNTV